MSDEGLPTTYGLIYAFLKKRSHEKAATAVKKAAKDVIILKDNFEEKQDDLNEIIKAWKDREEKQSANASSSEFESDDSDSSGSPSHGDPADMNSSSKDSNADSNLKRKLSRATKTNGKADDKSEMSGTSKSSSSKNSESSSESVKKERPGIGAKRKVSLKSISKKSNSTSKSKSDSSYDSSSGSSSSEDSSASESESGSSDAKLKTKQKKKGGRSATVPSPETRAANVKVTKKRRLSDSGQAKVTAVDEESKIPSQLQNWKPKMNGNGDNATTTPFTDNSGNKPSKSNTPFRRIKTDDVQFHDERLKDNTYIARGGAATDYGAKANQDLIVTRGDSFRKAKNKKKRGSYRGGEITLQSHSIKFT